MSAVSRCIRTLCALLIAFWCAPAAAAGPTFDSGQPELSQTAPKVGQTLTCSAAYSANNGTVTEAFAWKRDPGGTGTFTVISGQTSSTLNLGPPVAKGDIIRCEVTATDNDGPTTEHTGNGGGDATVDNTEPLTGDIVVTPAAPNNSNTLTCLVENGNGHNPAVDADGDPIDLTFAIWKSNGSATTGTAALASTTLTSVTTGSLTYALSSLAPDEYVACVVTADDGTDTTSNTSSHIQIVNRAPSITSVAITPTTTQYNDGVSTCTANGVGDADGDSPTVTFTWRLTNGSGSLIGSTTATGTGNLSGSLTLPGALSRIDPGELVHCTAVADDGHVLNNTASKTDDETVDNRVPSAPTVNITPTSAVTLGQEVLTCTATGSTDPDGDAITSYVFTWTNLSQTTQTAVTTLTATVATLDLSASPFSGAAFNDNIRCSVKAVDDEGGQSTAGTDSQTIDDRPPTASNVQISPSSPKIGDTVTCSATTNDPDGDTLNHTFRLVNTSDAITQTSATGTTASATFTFAGTDAKGENVRCGVTVTANGGTASANGSTTQIANTAPSTGTVALTPANPDNADTAVCTVSGWSDVDGDSPLTYTYTFFRNGTAHGTVQTTTASTATKSLVAYQPGHTVYCTVTASDGSNSSSSVQSNTEVIDNNAPQVTSVALGPATSYNDGTVSCVAQMNDPDGQNFSAEFTFRKSSTTGSTLGPASSFATASATQTVTFDLSSSAVSLAPEDAIYCVVDVDDGSSTGTGSDDLTLSNRAPATPSISFELNGSPITSAVVGQVVTCVASATDADGDVPTYSYSWTHQAGSSAGSTLSLTAANTNPASTISCTGTANDGHSSNNTSVSAATTLTIDNTAPVVSQVALDQSGYVVHDTMTCTVTASDADLDTLSYDYYFVNGTVTFKSFTNKSGSTQTYKLQGGDANVNDQIHCYGVADDGSATDDGTSATATVGNSPPVVTGLAISPSSGVKTNTQLVCSATVTEPDLEALTVTYAWTKTSTSGPALTGATGTFSGSIYYSTLQLNTGSVIPTDDVFCQITAQDTSSGSTVDDVSVAVGNRAPTIVQAAQITATTTPQVNDVITCTATATDPDGQGTTPSYSWTNGGSIGTSSVLTVTTANSDPNDVLTCTVTLEDPQNTGGDGEVSSSATATVQNTVPVVSGVAIGPSGSHTTATNLTCTVTASDPDALTLNYTYTWLRNGTTMSGGTSGIAASTFTKQLDNTQAAVNDLITCSVSVSDSLGATAGSAVTTIGNQGPTVNSVTLGPSSVRTDSVLSCTAAALEPDGDPLTYEIWAHNAGNTLRYVTNATSSSITTQLTNTAVQPGDVVTCEVTAFDPDGGSHTLSNTKAVDNTTPTFAQSAAITPNTGVKSDSTIVCSASATDVDDAGSGPPTLTYSWWNLGTDSTAVGTKLTTYTTDTITLNSTAVQPEEYLRCIVTATDALNGSITTSSPTKIQIENTLPTVTASVTQAPFADDSATITCTSNDVDGDQPTHTYSWTDGSSNTLLAAVSSSVIPVLEDVDVHKHETLTAHCTATDAYSGTASTTATTTVQNSSPTITVSVSSADTSITVTSTVSCDVDDTGDVDDADENNLSVGYEWQVRNGGGTTSLTTINGSTAALSTVNLSAGDAVYCVATITDPDGATGEAEAYVDIANATPNITAAPTLSPAVPVPNSSVDCVAPPYSSSSGFYDHDDPNGTDDYVFTFTWSNGASTVLTAVGTSQPTHTISGVTGNADWSCQVQIADLAGESDTAIYEFTVCYADADSDDWGDEDTFALAANYQDSCDDSGSQLADDALDCDDTSFETKPGLAVLDSGYSSSDNGGVGTCMKDLDGDLHGDSDTPGTANTSLYVAGDDCDDSDVGNTHLTYLGAIEAVNDGVDQDCDGADDCYVDSDGDGQGDTDTSNVADSQAFGTGTGTYASPDTTICDDPANGVANDALDCHDNEASAYFGAPSEICDGLDTDCDNGGTPPDDEIDDDGDQYVECTIVNNYFSKNNQYTHSPAVNGGLDCVDVGTEVTNEGDDIDAIDINPGITEEVDDSLIGDGVDNDCDQSTPVDSDNDGLIDSNYHNPAGDECYQDNDQDGFGDSTPLTTWDTQADGCNTNQGEAGKGLATDCNDQDQTVFPEAVELCDGQMNDCDGSEIPPDEVDNDGDGYIECCPNALYPTEPDAKLTFSYDVEEDTPLAGGTVYEECADFSYKGSDPNVVGGGDCLDDGSEIFGVKSKFIYPGHGNEECEAGEDQVDNDCNGDQNSYWDVNTAKNVDVAGDKNFYPDIDGDGFGDENAAPVKFCSAPSGYDSAPVDCDDRDADIFPGQNEFCNGRDDDCDGAVDNDDAGDIDPDNSGCLDYYRDSDGDLYGDEAQVECLCATDRCSDGEDNDNDGLADNDDPDCSGANGDEVDSAGSKYVDAGLDFVEFSNYYYISRQFDCYDLDSAIFPDSGVTRNEFDVITHRVETLDGHDNDCDGLMALVELDCDDDGSLAMLPLPRPSSVDPTSWGEMVYSERLNQAVGSALQFDDSSVVGLPRCDTTMKANYQLPAASITCWPNNAKLNLECDDATGLWMVSYQTDDGQGGIFDGGHHEFASRESDGDCDDTCASRFPGGDEICDGIDNDCSNAVDYYATAYDPDAQLADVVGMERDGVPDAMDSEKQHFGSVTTLEFDMDGDGFVSCGDYIGSLNEQDVKTDASCANALDTSDDTLLSDCNNFCALSTPVAEEACNGFEDLCFEGLEGSDGDNDGFLSCGAWSQGSGAAFDTQVFVLTVVNTAGGGVDSGSTDTADTGFVESGWPSDLPNSIPLFNDRPTAVDLGQSGDLPETCDEPLGRVLDEIHSYYTGPSDKDWMLEFCACVEGLENDFGDCSLFEPTGECVVVKVGLAEDDDQDIGALVADSANEDPGWPNAETWDCARDFPEQVVTRSVWNPERILEGRHRVVEWECIRLYGHTCTELAADPDLGGTVNVDGTLGETGVSAEITRDAPNEWPVTFGRYSLSVVSEGNILGCWGDPSTVGLEAVDDVIGGDCENSDGSANMYELEGPADLYGVWRASLPQYGRYGKQYYDPNKGLYLDIGELDCSTCLDGIDNNCDGQADCDDPACAPCFVGQGFGFGNAGDNPCAQPGCQQVAAAPSATRGFTGLALLAAAVLLTGVVGRRRDEEDEAPAAK